MQNIEFTRDFRVTIIDSLQSIEKLISYDDHVEFCHLAELIEQDVDFLLARLSHSENERFSEG